MLFYDKAIKRVSGIFDVKCRKLFYVKRKKLSGKKMLFERNKHAENELKINKNATNDAENRRLRK